MQNPFDKNEIDAALDRYSRLPLKHQLRVINEILSTRLSELRSAYRNITRIGLGVRRRRDRSGCYRSHANEPLCLVFMVSRKWPRKLRSTKGRVPECLLAYSVDSRGKSRLFAVPTDVDAARDLRSARTQLAVDATVAGSASTNTGRVSCAIRQTSPSAMNYGVSCRHVLSFGDTAELKGKEVFAGGTKLGKVAKIMGPTSGPGVMDAQLFEVTAPFDRTQFPNLEDYIRTPDDIPATMRLVGTSLGSAANVTLHRYWPEVPDDVSHKWMYAGALIAVTVTNGSTQNGDSGSPLVAGKTHPMLVGMHIGRTLTDDGGCISYNVPAWRLMNPLNYQGVTGSPTWKLA